MSRVARIAVGPSTVRGRGNKGTVAASRHYLRTVDLSQFGTPDRESFVEALDAETNRLLAKLPRGARHWGIARKVLNIFLRDCLYTTYLAERHQLLLAELFFELPLDSITAKHLLSLSAGKSLPRWLGVKYVTREFNKRFQETARQVAKKNAISPVHLDALWWSASRD